MKQVLLIALFAIFSVATYAQKSKTAQKTAGYKKVMTAKHLGIKIQESRGLSAQFKELASQALNTEDDCTPPPCVGIIDPWTCECHPDIRDPWEEDKDDDDNGGTTGTPQVEMPMDEIKAFEKAIKMGQGGKVLPSSLYFKANKQFPGDDFINVIERMNIYANAMR